MPVTSMRMRFIALAVATVVLVGGWFMIGFRPARSKLNEVNASVQASQAEAATLRTELARLQALKKLAPELRKRLAKLTTALPSEPGVSDFILQVQDAANLAGIDFLSIAPSLPAAPPAAAAPAPAAPASPAPGSSPAPSPSPGAAAPAAPTQQTTPASLQAISVSVNATGSFFELQNFIHRLEQLERAVRLNTFNLAPGGEAGSSALSTTLALQIFMVNRPAAAPVAPPSASPGA